MLIHLEAGNCASGTDQRDINEYIYESPDGRRCTENCVEAAPFNCPQCQVGFSTVSGLFQHAETRPDCSVKLDDDESLKSVLDDLKFRIIEI